jgi:Secretion system C-terminal sorting domain
MCGISTNNAWKIFNTTTVGTAETSLPSTPNLTVVPNPAQETIRLNFPTSAGETNTIQIYNLLGVLVYETNLSSTSTSATTTVDISAFPSGVFIVRVNSLPTLTTRFVKE